MAREVSRSKEASVMTEQRIDVNAKVFDDRFEEIYEWLYDNAPDGNVAGYDEAIDKFDELLANSESFKAFIGEFCRRRGDGIGSDREAAAFIFTLNDMVY